jgi:DNA polymerase III subunit epsilon
MLLFSDTNKDSMQAGRRNNSLWQNLVYRLLYKYYRSRAQKRGSQNGYEPEPAVTSAIAEKSIQVKKQVDWKRSLKSSRYIVFDTETTGFYPYHGDEIISIGGVVVEDGRICEDQVFHEFVNPFRSIPQPVTELTGICNNMVSDKRGVCSVINDFLDFIGDGILVAHNADFDMAFLNIKLNWYTQTEIKNAVIDTFKLSRVLSPELPSHDLDTLIRKHNVDAKGRHTALGDSLMTAEIFLDFLRQLEEREIDTLKQLYYYIHVKENFAFSP